MRFIAYTSFKQPFNVDLSAHHSETGKNLLSVGFAITSLASRHEDTTLLGVMLRTKTAVVVLRKQVSLTLSFQLKH